MNETQGKNWHAVLERFHRHPLVQISGWIVGPIGLVLAIYFYVAGQAKPELTYFVHPIRTVVVKAGEASDLTITHLGAVLSGNVSAANIAIWNGGNSPIRREDVLLPITIVTGAQHPILEAKIRTMSRPLIQGTLDIHDIAEGKVGFVSKILEKNDGVSVQIIYSGDTTVPIVMRGTVIGQNRPTEVEYSGRLLSPEQQYKSELTPTFGLGVGVAGTVSLLFALILQLASQPSAATRRALGKVFAIAGIVLGGLGAVIFYLSKYRPPFEF